jgi:tetratricopeptide (TPR) repeat protein
MRHLARAQHYREIAEQFNEPKFSELAIQSYDAAIAEQGGVSADILGARAGCYAKVGRFDEALRDFPIALRAVPDAVGGWINYGFALESVGEYERAIVCYNQAIEIDPNDVRALYNKGVCIERELGMTGKGITYFEKALEIDPTFNFARSGLSFPLMKSGKWTEGGWEAFEWRKLGGQRLQLPGLVWDGVPTTDELVLTSEQGLGDMIQFCRYAKIAAFNGQRTAIYAPTYFHKLLGTLGSNVRMIGDESEIVEPYQWLPIMSLPRLMGTTPTTVPLGKQKYLKADPVLVEHWREKLRPVQNKLKIGIAWNPGALWKPHTRSRAIPLKLFADIAAIENVQLVSLQKGGGEGEVNEMDFNVVRFNHDPVPMQDMFADCAAMIENLDLVISTDTSVLHLAGALGKKTLVALPVGACWRWLENDTTTTPWYGNMTLYRQTELNKWDDVIGRIADNVRGMARET